METLNFNQESLDRVSPVLVLNSCAEKRSPCQISYFLITHTATVIAKRVEIAISHGMHTKDGYTQWN